MIYLIFILYLQCRLFLLGIQSKHTNNIHLHIYCIYLICYIYSCLAGIHIYIYIFISYFHQVYFNYSTCKLYALISILPWQNSLNSLFLYNNLFQMISLCYESPVMINIISSPILIYN